MRFHFFHKWTRWQDAGKGNTEYEHAVTGHRIPKGEFLLQVRECSYCGKKTNTAGVDVKLQVGDRVSVYYVGAKLNNYATVKDISIGSVYQADHMKVDFDDGSTGSVHPKQCRRLKKKERRRVWLCIEPGGALERDGQTTAYAKQLHSNWIEFVEVKK